MQRKLGHTQRRICTALDVPRSTVRYVPRVADLTKRLLQRMLEPWVPIRASGTGASGPCCLQEGWRVNRKRVHRLWKQEGLRRHWFCKRIGTMFVSEPEKTGF
ncbi:MAG: hypothetical protein R3F05_16570 [Planctomycetota bacterium]